MKYIIYNLGHMTNCAVIFDRLTNHDDMASKLGHGVEVVSAGFVSLQIKDDLYPVPKCHGKSYSLRKESREEDSEILRKFFYNEQGY